MKPITILAALLLFTSGLAYGQAEYLDKTFGKNGIVDIENDLYYNAWPYQFATLPDGKILLSVSLGRFGVSAQAVVYRLNSDGKIDSSFAENGSASFNCSFRTQQLRLTSYPDGRMLLYGYEVWQDQYYYVKKAFVCRMLPSGTVDSTFGVNGGYYAEVKDSVTEFLHINITDDQKIFIVGREGSQSNGITITRPVCWRLTPDGHPDSSFSSTGKIYLPVQYDSINVYGVCSDSSGGCVVAAKPYSADSNKAIVLFRTNTDGRIDTTFGFGGINELRLTDGVYIITKILTLPDGSIMLSTNLQMQNTWRMLLIKLTKDGAVDLSFGSGGTTEILTDPKETYSSSFALDSSGRIIVVGNITNNFYKRKSLVFRFLPNGSIDSSFGLNGLVIPFDKYSYGHAYDIAIQSDGTYLMTGTIWPDTTKASLRILFRLHEDPQVSLRHTTSLVSSPISLHPTPSTDNCTITYTLPSSDNCTMTLRDESGREVRTFTTNEHRTAGEHKEELDLRGLAVGVYFLQIESNGSIQAAKLIKQ
jgi:uncharacterized delta-60 repeat protein